MKTKELILGMAIMLAMVSASFAGGGGTIKGNLVDEFNQPVPFAHVYLFEAGIMRGTTTDLDGKFTLKPIVSGSYDLFFTQTGFDTLKISGVRVISDRITMLRNQVMPTKTLKGFVLVGYPIPLIKIDEPSVIEFGEADIKHIPNRNSLAGMIAGITPGAYRASESDPLQFRGSRKSASLYFIDGVKMEAVDNAVPTTAVGNIRVYTGGIPAMYGDVVGGVVVIETKSFIGWYQKNKNNKNKVKL